MQTNLLRTLPAVHDILAAPGVPDLIAAHGHDLVVETIRGELDAVRRHLRDGQPIDGQATATSLAARVAAKMDVAMRPKLRLVINATGVILHTNLGRAPMAEAAARAAYEAARGYLNLELDLDSGKRSSRQDAVREWL
jgi:L-seryl-tRNA(Ser) seleniumtransferase